MQMEIELSKGGNANQSRSHQEPLNSVSAYQETKYRWIVVALTGAGLFLNGIASNAIAPLEHRMTIIYQVSEEVVSLSIILSFVIFFFFNFPANSLIDLKGTRLSLCLGTGLYFAGFGLYLLINKSYYLVLAGTFLMGVGQPFLINLPAKIASLWFYPKNRAFATAIMVGSNLFGLGIGFLIPTLAVKQDSQEQEARSEVKYLFLFYFIYAGLCLIFSLLFMQDKPEVAPSQAAILPKLSAFLESLKQIKRSRNLWLFFAAYCIFYGTLITFAVNSNFIFKPYGYSDLLISVNTVILMVFGIIGSILLSLYLKKASNYRRALLTMVLGSALMIIMLSIWMNTVKQKVITTFIVSMLGLAGNPIVTLCYELGAELCFPMSQTMVTGFLNAGSLLWAFLASGFVTSVFGYDSIRSSMLIMIFLSTLVLLPALSFNFLKVQLKRKNYQQQQKKPESSTGETENTPQEKIKPVLDNITIELESYNERGGKYSELVEENKADKVDVGYL